MRIAWLTDIHLNFLTPAGVDRFLAVVRAADADALLISGDIAEAHDLIAKLGEIDRSIAAPIYFVLGNHDFYHGSIHEMRARVTAFCAERPELHYLSTAPEAIGLSSTLGLVGHDGWGDARLGDYEGSTIRLNDDLLIHELRDLNKQDRRERLMALGDEAAAYLARVLPDALARFPHVVVLTHVPPFAEACWHEGNTSGRDWMPFFTCAAVGDVLLAAMRNRPDRQMTVLCGHTHSGGECRPSENLTVLTGQAKYGDPVIERIFEW